MSAAISAEADRFLSPIEAARFLSVQVGTLKKWRFYRRGPRYSRVGDGRVRYRLSSLVAFIEFGAEVA
jgi:hypothetical protein